MKNDNFQDHIEIKNEQIYKSKGTNEVSNARSSVLEKDARIRTP